MLIKKIQKHLYILKHDASDVQKGNIEQVIVCIFNMRSSYYIDVSFYHFMISSIIQLIKYI